MRLPYGHSSSPRRRGAVIPLMALVITAILGFVALSIDLGLLMVARNNCQNAADSAAIAGVRTINGDNVLNYRREEVPVNAVDAALQNPVMTTVLEGNKDNVTPVSGQTDTWKSGKVQIELGSYTYAFGATVDSEGFRLRFPRNSGEPYGAVRSRVSFDAGRYAFAQIFGVSTFATGATATAIHRPRDVVVIMDLSGSMRFQSMPAVAWDGNQSYPSANNRERNRSMNPESVFPKFGHYSDVAGAALQGTASLRTDNNEFVDPSNISTTTASGPPIAEFFYTDVQSTNRAFTRASDSFENTPGGDVPLKTGATQTDPFSSTLRTALNTPANQTNLAWEQNGYTSSALTPTRSTFHGYTQGPGYWGKTFFMWPPDPGEATTNLDPANYANNGARDWRQRFFIKVPLTASFTGRVEQSAGNVSPNQYNAGHTGLVRIISLTGTPEVGDTVTFSNQANRAYTVIEVGALLATGVREIRLNRALVTQIRDTDNVTASFREVAWLRDNDLLFDSNGDIRAPGPYNQAGSSTLDNTTTIGSTPYFYRVNYAAILNWLVNIGPNPFPTTLRGGRLHYYRVMPPFTDPLLNQRIWTDDLGSYSSDQQQSIRFWRDYIDFVLGFDYQGWRTQGSNTYEWYRRFNTSNIIMSSLIGNGRPYSWGTTRISPAPTIDNTTAYLSARTTLSTKLAGTNILNVGSLSPSGTNPRVGDVLQISGQSTVYTVTAVVLGTTLTISPNLTANVNTGVNVTFKQIGYMHYEDNPRRPRHQFWFGPMTFIDFVGNYNTGQLRWPGNAPEAQSWACKTGIEVALRDMRVNCPNDYISTIFYSSPTTHRQAKTALRSIGDSGHYNRVINSLWFPPSVYNSGSMATAEIEWTSGDLVPRADGGTGPGMGFLLAYNQLSSSRVVEDLRTYAINSSSLTSPENGIVGGRGRKGAQKMIIYETDGAPNSNATADFVSKTSVAADGTLSNDSYYKVRMYDRNNTGDSRNESPITNTGDLFTNLYDIVQTICNNDAANWTGATSGAKYGHSTNRRPVLVHSIGYGTLYAPESSGTTQTNAMNSLQRIQFIGRTASDTNGLNFPEYKRIYGTSEQRITKMKEAFTRILQDGVTVTLLE
ncbi:Tad domain-containing protein [Tuwongella immobilis]|uniref:Putative Flp pilus-assembly TadG-like N-terminal domain-containing protein n=1 Tax=Tuwongella immobilis TaxID=692036 RepID=A0A6C2YHU7_9BACT|nr:Tad domain-containing protein [Tuwongella immobilis]VIP00997.1 Uncharacterized protein OS=Singulisphaera acidiphila (strain ATCC BAA-1392 / DSM 18658 / VKM B-2454 / MOB10) GN=Sinac_7493 PE=4 SV=1: Tad [Tuwongella immobilis]VTR97417.1 Uncharacterized protein OS=Singulisphaera acidiphila (strain ATCC BAA-1392 / DSM 18658 / VKM B-2454 / MOB10) GN=Sinac_7493 PE=4 SV=1: Tad [Tuwongella immobilis]